MNRSNIGNVITNGMQILSVGATTASHVLGSADKALNNLTPEERKKYDLMRADKMREEMQDYYNPERQLNKQFKENKIKDEREAYYAKGSSPMQHLTLDEKTKFQKMKAEKIKESINDSNEIEEDNSFENPALAIRSVSPQSEEGYIKITRDNDWLNSYLTRGTSQGNIDLINKITGGF